MTQLRVLAFDETGDRRVPYLLEESDLVEWKRQGATGFQWGRVDFLRTDQVPRPIRIMPLAADRSSYGGRARWISSFALMHVYDSKGVRKRNLPE